LGEHLQPVNFERIAPARLAGWVQKHFLHDGVEAAPAVCTFMVSWCGRDMHQLASEVQKVAFYVRANGRTEVTESDIRTAAVSAMEYDSFAFANAVMEWRREEALRILQDLKFRRVEPLFILSEVSRTMCDLLSVSALLAQGSTAGEIAQHLHMHEYKAKLYVNRARTLDAARLRVAVEACDQADKAMKLSPKGYDILERLICSI
jgi:DNA polymerase-3 subunit delta